MLLFFVVFCCFLFCCWWKLSWWFPSSKEVIFQTYELDLCPGSCMYKILPQCRKYFRTLQTRDLANEYSFKENDGSLPPDMRWVQMKKKEVQPDSHGGDTLQQSVCPSVGSRPAWAFLRPGQIVDTREDMKRFLKCGCTRSSVRLFVNRCEGVVNRLLRTNMFLQVD